MFGGEEREQGGDHSGVTVVDEMEQGDEEDVFGFHDGRNVRENKSPAAFRSGGTFLIPEANRRVHFIVIKFVCNQN